MCGLQVALDGGEGRKVTFAPLREGGVMTLAASAYMTVGAIQI